MKRQLKAARSFIKAFGFRLFCQRVFNTLVSRPFRRFIRGSYSQNYEDIIVDRLLDHKMKGFYVDIGANDPIRSNNTMRFYQRDWSGINIEPNVHCYLRIAAKRKKDINLNIGIGSEVSNSTFYSFLPETRSTFSAAVADELIGKGLRLVEKNEVEILPLSMVLDQYRSNKAIDFMSIDTEGYDDKVILSNDWDRHRPEVICIESDIEDTTHRYLLNLGYRKVVATPDNYIYQLHD